MIRITLGFTGIKEIFRKLECYKIKLIKMEEIEVSTEHLTEQINEKAEELYEKKERWTLGVAISTAVMAVLAAIAGLLAGHYSNEALIQQIKSSDQWAFYQAKSIKAEIRALQADNGNKKTNEQIKKEEEAIKFKAEEAEKLSEFYLQKHVVLARSVTLLQISIAISAIAILTRKRFMWLIAIGIALCGLGFLIAGVI